MGASAEYKQKSEAGTLSGVSATVRILGYEPDPRGYDSLATKLRGELQTDVLGLPAGSEVTLAVGRLGRDHNLSVEDLRIGSAMTGHETPAGEIGGIVTFENCELDGEAHIEASHFEAASVEPGPSRPAGM